MAAVEGERGNWIAALAWALESKNDVALGQRLMLGRPIWMNWNGQPRRWLRLALDSVTEATEPGLAAALLIKEAAVLTELGDYEQGARSGEAGVRIYRAMGDVARLAGALYVTGAGLVFCGRIADGTAAIEEAIELLRATGDKANLAYALLALGQARAAVGDLEAERALVREARASFDPEALRSSVGGGLWQSAADQLEAENKFASGDADGAVRQVTSAVATLRAFRHRGLPALLTKVSAYLVKLDRFDEAREYAREALLLLRDAPSSVSTDYALQHLAAAAVLRSGATGDDDLPKAARMLGFVDARRRERKEFAWYTERQEWDRALAALQGLLPEAEAATLMGEGARMSLDDAIDLAQSI
jgi:tetratricopeptide (TPR) repeat protein